MKSTLRILSLSAVLAGTALSISLLVGCHTRQVVADGIVCPACKMQTQAQSVETCDCTKGICPSCRKVTDLSPQQEQILRRYVGISSDRQTVRVCTHCKAVIAQCPACRKPVEVIP